MRPARLRCTQLEDRHTPTSMSPPLDLTLTGGTVTEFRPDHTLVGTFSTKESGGGHTLTYELVGGDGADDNGSFGIVGDQLLTQVALDHAAKPSLSVRVRVTDETAQTSDETAFAVSVADDPNVNLIGRTLYIAGTAGADSFSATTTPANPIFPPGSIILYNAVPTPRFELNGVALAAVYHSVDAVVFNGRGGNDSAYLVSADANESVPVRGQRVDAIVAPSDGVAGYGLLKRPDYSVYVDAPNVTIAGQAGDVAYLAGTSGADALVSTPTYTTLTGAGYFAGVMGFGSVAVYGNGGADTASMAGGSDHATLNGSPTAVTVAGAGYFNTASGFASVTAYTGTGGGLSFLEPGTSKDVREDVFDWPETNAERVVVTGPTFKIEAIGFAPQLFLPSVLYGPRNLAYDTLDPIVV